MIGLLLIIGPLLWMLFVFKVFSAQFSDIGVHWAKFLLISVVQLLLFALPFMVFNISVREAGLQDFVFCPKGQEYCDEFWELEGLRSDFGFQIFSAFWAGNALWLYVVFKR